MLTVKHIDELGFERVFEASEIRTRGRLCGSAVDAHRPNYVVECESADRVMIGDGQVYVMNGSGKTVASYDLSGDEVEADVRRAYAQVKAKMGGGIVGNIGTTQKSEPL